MIVKTVFVMVMMTTIMTIIMAKKNDDHYNSHSPELRAAPSHRTGLAFHAAMLKHQVYLLIYTFFIFVI